MMNSAAQVFTGQNGGNGTGVGSAAILDQHPDFEPFAQNIYNARIAERARKVAEDKQKQKDWAALQKAFDPKAVQLRDQKQMMGKLGEMEKELVDLRVNKKLDPTDVYGEGGQRWRELKFEAENLAKASNDNLAWRAATQKALSDDVSGKYDKAHGMDVLKQYDALPTIEEQTKFREENNPLKADISDLDIVNETIPDLFKSSIEKGNRTEAVEGIIDGDYRTILESYVYSERGKEAYDAGVEDGRWRDFDSFANRIISEAKAKKPGSRTITYDEPKTPTAAQSKTYNYGGNTWGDYSVSGSRQDAATPEGQIDTVAVSQNGGSMKELQLVDNNGNVVNGKPAMFKKAPVKTFKGQKSPNSGKWEVYVESVVPAVDESGEPITDSNGAPVMRPQTVVVDYEKNKNQIEAALEGMSVEEWAKAHGQGGQETVSKSKGSKYVIKGKSYTLGELTGMGYTEEQVAKYRQ